MTKYYLAGGTRVAMRTGSTFYWLLSDHLGSTSKVATAAGALHSQQLYKAWGESRYTSGTLSTRYTYTGQYSDSYINLYWYGSRWYDSELGRFISPDPIIPEPYNPLAYDRYQYVYSNPVRWVDPAGHFSEDPGSGCSENPEQCIRAQIRNKMDLLLQLTKAGKIKDLEAFAQLTEYAAVFTPTCPECFVQNLGAVLTGDTDGAAWAHELQHQLNGKAWDPNYDPNAQFGQSGFDWIFQDPNSNGGVIKHIIIGSMFRWDFKEANIEIFLPQSFRG